VRKITLDRRFSGFNRFKFALEYTSKELDLYCQHREWFWTTFNSSCELEAQYKISNPNPDWCWELTQWKIRIYVKSDKEMNWFALKWGV
jgi:hypothetical protein